MACFPTFYVESLFLRCCSTVPNVARKNTKLSKSGLNHYEVFVDDLLLKISAKYLGVYWSLPMFRFTLSPQVLQMHEFTEKECQNCFGSS